MFGFDESEIRWHYLNDLYRYHKDFVAFLSGTDAMNCNFVAKMRTRKGRSFKCSITREAVQDAYGPTMISCLEYVAHRYGVHPHLGRVWFSLGSGKPYEYEAVFAGHACSVRSDGKYAELRMDGKNLGRRKCGRRVIAGEDGTILRTELIEDREADI